MSLGNFKNHSILMKKSKKRIATDFLLSKMSFLTGMGSVFNLGGSYYDFNTSKSSTEADFKAIFNDWQMISQDFLDVLEKSDFDKEKISKERDKILNVR